MAAKPPPLDINPPLLNSASPAATTLDQLRELYNCQSTGAVTTRTCLIGGFGHQDAIHQYAFFDPVDQSSGDGTASLNNLGYSPVTLSEYLGFIRAITEQAIAAKKPFIISVTGTPEEVAECYSSIVAAAKGLPCPLAMEINLSCPNIPGAPPPAYDGSSLRRYLDALSRGTEMPEIPVGIKTPPYTHANDFKTLVSALSEARPCGISFITATNTLGSCLVLAATGPRDGPAFEPALTGSGMGGMAGPPLHPLALGNVATLRKMLDEDENVSHIRVIGVGGVSDAQGYQRMRSVGAYAVALATALIRGGVGVFETIGKVLD